MAHAQSCCPGNRGVMRWKDQIVNDVTIVLEPMWPCPLARSVVSVDLDGLLEQGDKAKTDYVDGMAKG